MSESKVSYIMSSRLLILAHSYNHTLIHSYTRTLNESYTHTFIHSYTQYTHTLIHSYTHTLILNTLYSHSYMIHLLTSVLTTTQSLKRR